MCGIAGIITGNDLFKKSALERMSAALSHRGPDDLGMEVIADLQNQAAVGLAHRRLSIIDTSASGHQPMASADKTIRAVYNGEIYNFRELRSELQRQGHVFVSRSDTEVLINAYLQWGHDFIGKLRGMFSFVIYDGRNGKLICAVDRFGIKPLYYYRAQDKTFVFASELRSLLAGGMIAKEIDPLAVDSYLAFGAVQSPLTMIKGVRALLPATMMTYELGSGDLREQEYWQPFPGTGGQRIMDEKEAVRVVREGLEESVTAHLVSDVPVGIFLSGGIDSSALAAIANGKLKAGLRSFSVVFSEEGFTEARYSRLVARSFCPEHTEISVRQDDALEIIPQALAAMDQPSVDGINVFFLSRMVRRNDIKVVLSGQGGDELFGGYSTFSRFPFARALSVFGSGIPFIKLPLEGPEMFDVGKVKTAGIVRSGGDLFSIYAVLRQLFSKPARDYLLAAEAPRNGIDGFPQEVSDKMRRAIRGLDLFSSVSFLELRGYLANMLLRDSDSMSMAHSLEIRVPFLDDQLLSRVAMIPPKIKARRPAKYLLRKAMAGNLPHELFNRPKMGFVFPWELWMRDRLTPAIEEVIYGEGCSATDMAHCRKLWEYFKGRAPGISWSRPWAVYVLLSWIRRNLS